MSFQMTNFINRRRPSRTEDGGKDVRWCEAQLLPDLIPGFSHKRIKWGLGAVKCVRFFFSFLKHTADCWQIGVRLYCDR